MDKITQENKQLDVAKEVQEDLKEKINTTKQDIIEVLDIEEAEKLEVEKQAYKTIMWLIEDYKQQIRN